MSLRSLLTIISSIAIALTQPDCRACTSAIVAPAASASGRPMLWKHRDTSCESNFIARVEAGDNSHAYVALFNAGDSLLREAWIGFNDAGFAIMNTASYNLAPDTAVYKDREGFIMSEALRTCSTVDDFERLLTQLPKPLGVQANFGVIDARGNGVYFETDDFTFTKFDISETADGVMLRTNFSVSGDEGGYGYIRYDNAGHLLTEKIASRSIIPADFTEGLSRSFYHSLKERDAAADSCRWVVDQDFIPRSSSTASVVIEIDDQGKAVMWAALGYPPCAVVRRATLDDIPASQQPRLKGFRSSDAEAALARKRKAFPIVRGSGAKYIDMDYLRSESQRCHNESMKNYGL